MLAKIEVLIDMFQVNIACEALVPMVNNPEKLFGRSRLVDAIIE
jgi:hypothetical protein